MKNKEIEELLNELKDVAKKNTIEVREYGVVETISSSLNKELRLNSYSANLLLSYIEQLRKKIDQYENPEDLTLFYMWLDTNAKDKMKQLQQENQQLKKQKDDVVEYIKEHKHLNWYVESCYTDNLLRMLGEIDVED